MMRRPYAACLVVLSAAFAAACTVKTDPKGDGGAKAADDGGGCLTSGTGTLRVNIDGLPGGVAANVHVVGPAGDRAVTSSDVAESAQGGAYEVSAASVTRPDAIVRTVYAATVDVKTVCLEGGQTKTVHVSYAEVASSGKLWHLNQNTTRGEVLGFASAALAASGAPAASVAAKGPAGKSVAFDRDGNLWAFGATTSDASLVRFAASSLGSSGAKEPDRAITLDVGCQPGLTSMAFGPDGSLWASSACAKRVFEVPAEALAASGTATPSVVLSGLGAPEGIAFDKDGNLWVADSEAQSVRRYDAARLAASSESPPTLSIASKTAGDAELPPSLLAFDARGHLWASSFGGNVLFDLGLTELTGTGDRTVVPAVQITVSVGALLEGMAFDESGGLFFTFTQGKIARLAPGQLTTSSDAGAPTVPQTVIASADIGSAAAMALFPAPAALPLAAALP